MHFLLIERNLLSQNLIPNKANFISGWNFIFLLICKKNWLIFFENFYFNFRSMYVGIDVCMCVCRCLRSRRKGLPNKWLFLLQVYLFVGITTAFILGHFCKSFCELKAVPPLKIVPQGCYKYFSIPLDNTLQQLPSLRKSMQNNFP